MKRFAVLFFMICSMAFFVPPKKKIKIWMIGDSTMCIYESNRAPLAGWGMPFAGFFDSTVKIENKARGGRSTRTFISENRWQPIADSLQEGDYVLIQFGHNDEAKEEKYKERYTPVPDYKNNLIKFITETRAKKAIPVLITPVSRMRFDKEGKALETHVEYSAAVWEIGKAYDVPVIDLDAKSRNLFQQYGPEYAKMFFMQLEPMQHPNYPDGQKDNTHFNEFGARRMAELVLAEIRNLKLELAERVVVPPVKK
jgi:lysophospholipase L1-like esterase